MPPGVLFLVAPLPASFFPHSQQNLSSGGPSVPHWGQADRSFPPHWQQNLFLPGFWVLQSGHSMQRTSLSVENNKAGLPFTLATRLV